MSPNQTAVENEGVHFLYWVTLIAAALIGALSILF